MCALSLLQECRVWLAYDHPPRARPFASICDVRGTAWYAMALCHDNVALIALLLLLLLLLSLLSRFGGDPRVHTVSSCRVVLCVSCQMTSQRGGRRRGRTLAKEGKKDRAVSRRRLSAPLLAEGGIEQQDKGVQSLPLSLFSASFSLRTSLMCAVFAGDQRPSAPSDHRSAAPSPDTLQRQQANTATKEESPRDNNVLPLSF